jgi:hypothetical protein
MGFSAWTELAGIAGVSWNLCNGNKERKAWDLLWHGMGGGVYKGPFIV